VFQASAGGVTVEGNAPPTDAPAEAFMEKLAKVVAPSIFAQALLQFVVIAR
jgi:hypothetical protein